MIFFTKYPNKKNFWEGGRLGGGARVSDFFTKDPTLRIKKIWGGEGSGCGVDGRTDGRAQTNLPLQLLRRLGA